MRRNGLNPGSRRRVRSVTGTLRRFVRRKETSCQPGTDRRHGGTEANKDVAWLISGITCLGLQASRYLSRTSVSGWKPADL
jgi:hypothetical protein